MLAAIFFRQRQIKPPELTLFSRASYPKLVFGLNCDPKLYIIEGSNILRRQAPRACAETASDHSPVRVPGISEISRESFHHKTPAHAHRVDIMEGFEDDQFQSAWRGRNFVDDDRDAGNCTGSRSRARLAGFLPEPGCRIPIKRDSERHGIGTRRLACERASEADLGETPRQRSQDVTVPHSLAFSAIVHVSANR
jgi:hypothetical protein